MAATVPTRRTTIRAQGNLRLDASSRQSTMVHAGTERSGSPEYRARAALVASTFGRGAPVHRVLRVASRARPGDSAYSAPLHTSHIYSDVRVLVVYCAGLSRRVLSSLTVEVLEGPGGMAPAVCVLGSC